jgi:hypothetical protein
VSCPLAQSIGIAFALFGKFDDPLGEDCIRIMPPLGINGYACRRESKADDTLRLGVESLAVENSRDGQHGRSLRQYASQRTRFYIKCLYEKNA